MVEESRKLYRSGTDYILAGVAGGLAHYLNVDPVIIRLVFVALTFGGGSGIIIYIVLAFILPKEPGEATPVNREDKVVQADNIGVSGKSDSGHNLVAMILILLGVILLSNQLIPNWFRWDIFWPLAIILAGVYLLLRR